jgi:hypothetical protein
MLVTRLDSHETVPVTTRTAEGAYPCRQWSWRCMTCVGRGRPPPRGPHLFQAPAVYHQEKERRTHFLLVTNPKYPETARLLQSSTGHNSDRINRGHTVTD